jgi:hypothetical protein
MPCPAVVVVVVVVRTTVEKAQLSGAFVREVKRMASRDDSK